MSVVTVMVDVTATLPNPATLLLTKNGELIPNAPKFNGKSSSELLQYLEDIDFIGDAVGLDNTKKIKAVLHYTALDEVEAWQTLPELTVNPANWDEFIKAVKKMVSR